MRKFHALAWIPALMLMASSCVGPPPPPRPPYMEAPRKPAPGKASARKARSRPRKKVREKPGKRTPMILLPVLRNDRDKTEMMFIPKGPLLLPSSGAAAPGSPLETFEVDAFYMDKLEITGEQFRSFLADGKMPGNRAVLSCPRCPVAAVTYDAAAAYCRWAGKRLPGELEWLKAASSGGTLESWPWGRSYKPGRANFWGDGDGFSAAAPVGSFVRGAGIYGVRDMSGNVWEWTAPPYLPPGRGGKKVPEGYAVLKGGSWRNLPERTDLFYRHVVPRDLALENFGFRCAKSF